MYLKKIQLDILKNVSYIKIKLIYNRTTMEVLVMNPTKLVLVVSNRNSLKSFKIFKILFILLLFNQLIGQHVLNGNKYREKSNVSYKTDNYFTYK